MLEFWNYNNKEYYAIKSYNNEVWKDVENFEGCYRISNFGRVHSLKRKIKTNYFKNKYTKEIIIKPIPCKKGYLRLVLRDGESKKAVSVHYLVATHFIPNPENKPTINHINEIKFDNRKINLEWMTIKENNNYGARNKNISLSLTNGKGSKTLYQYTMDNELVKVWISGREASRNGFIQGHVASCARGERPHYKGFKWSYIKLH